MSLENTANQIRALGKFKPNPHHYIIVDKWNIKEYNKVKSKIFDLIDDLIAEEIAKQISQSWMENFTKLGSFSSTIEQPMDFWELYKKQLPLWSNINNNCYVKLKES